MRNLLSIFKKELRTYFETAIGYIYLIVFLLVSVGLYITPFFTYPSADMRYFFNLLPILLCVFMPAITMRLWAEERKANTLEMLLTFPMRSQELVLGKFFGSLAFYGLALLGTATIPLMLAVLGNPDGGVIFSAYVGAFLLGAFFLSLGLFISGLSKDQIVSFVLTLMICFGLFLIGTNFFAAYVDGVWAGLGSFLSRVLGITTHFETFSRGVIELADVTFFLAWTVIFLILNGLSLERRHRPGAQVVFSGAVAISLVSGLLFNWLVSGHSLGRLDLTENKIYTISPASKEILQALKVPVQVKLYITPSDKMPTEMKRLEQDILDKLKDVQVASGGKLNFKAIHMEAANVIQPPPGKEPANPEEKKDASLEQSLMEKGVRPFSVQALREDQATTQLVYSSLGIAYKEKPEEIIPTVVPASLGELEYRLVSTIYKLTREKAPVIALVAPMEELQIDPQMANIYAQLGMRLPTAEDPYTYLQQVLHAEKYDVRRVNFTAEQPLPADCDTLVIVEPGRLNERQKWEINRILLAGKSVFLAVQMNAWDYNVRGNGLFISRLDKNPQLNDLLRHYGMTVREDILMDTNFLTLNIRPSRDVLSSLLGGGIPLNLPTHILINQSSLNPDVSITSKLGNIFYLWGAALDVNDKTVQDNGLKVTTLINTSPQSWTIPPKSILEQADVMQPASGQQFPVALLASGQFPDVYKDQPMPAWPQPLTGDQETTPAQEETPADLPPAPGKLILVGGSEMFSKNFISQSGIDFFLNSIDALTLGDKLINVRGNKPIDRSLDKPSAATRSFWKFVNLGLLNVLIAALGIGIATLRRKSRRAYALAHKA